MAVCFFGLVQVVQGGGASVAWGPIADRTHPNLTLAVLALGGLAYALLSSAVVPALPTMREDLGTSETGITWLLTGYLLAAVSSSLALLIAARFIQGVGGGIFPLAYGIVRDEFPPEKVAGGIGMLSASTEPR